MDTIERYTSSPSRTYVITINRTVQVNGEFHYGGNRFVKFVLPESADRTLNENNAATASCYYLNQLDSYSYVGACYAAEDFANVTEYKP